MTRRILAALLALLLLTVSAYCEEEFFPTCDFDLDAYGGTLNVTFTDGSVEETGAWGFCTELGEESMTIGDILANNDIAEFSAVNEEDVFEGWLAFEQTITVDEFGFDEYIYTLMSDIPLTTEELLATPATETYTIFAAKWESIPAEEYFQESEDDGEFIYMAAATLFSNGGAILVHSEEEDYEIAVSVASIEPGLTVGEVLELDDILSVTRKGYEFAGWTVYDVPMIENTDVMPEDESLVWFETFEEWYSILHDCTVIAECVDTDTLREIVCGETDLFVVAEWK